MVNEKWGFFSSHFIETGAVLTIILMLYIPASSFDKIVLLKLPVGISF